MGKLEVGHIFQGTIDTPSGRFPSERYRPEGSKRDGTCAATKALCMMSAHGGRGGRVPYALKAMCSKLRHSGGRYGFYTEVVLDEAPYSDSCIILAYSR